MTVAAVPRPTLGFFGKLPCRGDFLRQGLPDDFVGPWDAWVTAGLEAGRHAMGDVWDDAYMTMPPWHFLLAPGACGPLAAAGVLVPSVDRVGRRYPFAIVLASTAPLPSPAEAWFSAAERSALRGLALPCDAEPSGLLVGLGDAWAPAASWASEAPGDGGSLWSTAGREDEAARALRGTAPLAESLWLGLLEVC